jgi:hypothetical protein
VSLVGVDSELIHARAIDMEGMMRIPHRKRRRSRDLLTGRRDFGDDAVVGPNTLMDACMLGQIIPQPHFLIADTLESVTAPSITLVMTLGSERL